MKKEMRTLVSRTILARDSLSKLLYFFFVLLTSFCEIELKRTQSNSKMLIILLIFPSAFKGIRKEYTDESFPLLCMYILTNCRVCFISIISFMYALSFQRVYFFRSLFSYCIFFNGNNSVITYFLIEII